MVHADADGGMVFAADVEEGHKLPFYLLQLLCVLLVGVFQMFESASRVNVVSWIDAHLLTVLGSHVGDAGIEMDVGDKRCHIAFCLQCSTDVAHVLRLAGALRREPDEFAARFNDADGLTDARVGVHRIGGRHRLHADGVIAADGDVAHMGDGTLSSFDGTHRTNWF